MAQYEELKKMIDDNVRWINNTLKDMWQEYNAIGAKVAAIEKAAERRKTDKCPAWAKDSVQRAIDNGILTGDGGATPTVDNVRPKDYLTRAEMAIMLEREAANSKEKGCRCK